MIRLVLLRLVGAIPNLAGVVVVTFLLTRALPGDPAAFFAGAAATPEAVEQIREKLGLNRNLAEQFGVYLRDLTQIVTVIVMLVLFTGTVFYPRAMVPSVFSGVVGANPISWPTDALRAALLQGRIPEWASWGYYAVAAVLVPGAGGLLFRALRPGFADVL